MKTITLTGATSNQPLYVNADLIAFWYANAYKIPKADSFCAETIYGSLVVLADKTELQVKETPDKIKGMMPL